MFLFILYITGKYTSDIDAVLTIPRRVDAYGKHLTHNLTHDQSHGNDDALLHYHIDLNNATLHVELLK